MNRRITRISRQEDAWIVTSHTGLEVQTRRLVIACPTYEASSMLKDFDGELSEALSAIPMLLS